MNASAVRDEIRKQIKASQEADNIDDLLDASTAIAGYLVYLQSDEATWNHKYLLAYEELKVYEAAAKRENIDAGMKIGEAESRAIEQSAERRANRAKCESEWKSARTFRLVVIEYLDSLRQRISYLKAEADRDRYTSGVERQPEVRIQDDAKDREMDYSSEYL